MKKVIHSVNFDSVDMWKKIKKELQDPFRIKVHEFKTDERSDEPQYPPIH